MTLKLKLKIKFYFKIFKHQNEYWCCTLLFFLYQRKFTKAIEFSYLNKINNLVLNKFK